MAQEILDQIRDILDGQTDFEGQKLAEQLTNIGLSAGGALSLIVGYATQNITLALKIALACALLTLLAVVPPWPCFNQHPVNWLPENSNTLSNVSQNLVIEDEKLERSEFETRLLQAES